MQLAPIPENEAKRIEAVYSTHQLDSEPEERFDRITRITQRLFNAPSAFITLVDENRVWFKSHCGAGGNTNESPRDLSFCGHTICNNVTEEISSRLFEVADAHKDVRFYDNSFITKACKIRYYLGFVIQSITGFNIGVFFIIDSKPRILSNTDKQLFSDLGLIVEAEFNKQSPSPQTKFSSLVNNLLYNKNPEELTNNFLNFSDKINSIFPVVNKLLQKNGVNFKEWRILNEIVQTETPSPQLISKKLIMSAPLVSRYLESLELQGLIYRTAPKIGDKRFVQIECTDTGKEIWKKGVISTYHEASSYLDEGVI